MRLVDFQVGYFLKYEDTWASINVLMEKMVQGI